MYKHLDLNGPWCLQPGESRVVALPIDPTRLFVYWAVNEEERALVGEHFCSVWTELPLYLCVYDVTDVWFDGTNGPLVRQERVSPEAENWYFHSLAPGRNYVVDLATTTIQNRWFSILRSNTASLPPEQGTPLMPRVRFTTPCFVSTSLETSLNSPFPPAFDGYHIHEPGGDPV